VPGPVREHWTQRGKAKAFRGKRNISSGKGTNQWVNRIQCDRQAGEGKTLLPLLDLHLAGFQSRGDGFLIAVSDGPDRSVLAP
jgi:hypothetical protein